MVGGEKRDLSEEDASDPISIRISDQKERKTDR